MSIPESYYSEYEGRPFQCCTRCGESLAEMTRGYQIVKYWHNHEVTYEYALCDTCHAGLLEQFSQESKDKLQGWHHERMELSHGMVRCATCRKPAAEISEGEYSVTGLISGQVLGHEILVCGQCSAEMQGLMSEHTRGTWDRFVSENFPTAPADFAPDPVALVKV